jgi:type II secretory pathway component PulF
MKALLVLIVDAVRGISSGKLLRYEPTVLLRQLASMLRRQVPMPQALGFIAEDFSGATAARLTEMRERIVDGEALSVALGALPQRWAPPSFRAAIAAGEASGRLPEVLDALADERGRLKLLAGRLRGAMLYPAIVLFVAILSVSTIAPISIPVFRAMSGAGGSDVSGVASWPLWVFSVMRWSMPALALLIALEIFSVFFWRVRFLPFGRFGIFLADHLPIARSLRLSLLELRFARLFRLLLDAGVPLSDALLHCCEALGDHYLGDHLVEAAAKVRDGQRPSEVLGGLEFLSPTFLYFLNSAEERGDFLDLTAAMAETAEERFLERVDLVERIAEPLAIVLIGIVVGFVLVQSFMPILSVTQWVPYA